jgi:hypothetical protein
MKKEDEHREHRVELDDWASRRFTDSHHSTARNFFSRTRLGVIIVNTECR